MYRSKDDGGLPILGYELWMDNGALTPFSQVQKYDFSTHGFQYTVNKQDETLVTGLYYRFKFRSMNELGYSQFSDELRVGLGPLPSKPSAPFKSIDESLSSSTSLYI